MVFGKMIPYWYCLNKTDTQTYILMWCTRTHAHMYIHVHIYLYIYIYTCIWDFCLSEIQNAIEFHGCLLCKHGPHTDTDGGLSIFHICWYVGDCRLFIIRVLSGILTPIMPWESQTASIFHQGCFWKAILSTNAAPEKQWGHLDVNIIQDHP